AEEEAVIHDSNRRIDPALEGVGGVEDGKRAVEDIVAAVGDEWFSAVARAHGPLGADFSEAMSGGLPAEGDHLDGDRLSRGAKAVDQFPVIDDDGEAAAG